MQLLIDAGNRSPDTRIFWALHDSDVKNASDLVRSFMNTSRHSAFISGQDADEFFRVLLDELKACPPEIIRDPLYLVKDLKDNLVFAENKEIERLVSEHQRKVNEIRAGLGEEGVLSISSTVEANTTLNEELRQAQKMQAIGQLAGGVAHDFNNVLTTIIGYSDLLLSNHRPSDESFQDIMQIKQNANRAAGLVRQLLAFSRRQTLRPQTLQLNDVLSELQMLLRRLVGETIQLDVVHGRDLWLVKADLNQFEQVIVNLVVNARDAMPDGGKITLRTRNLAASECGRLKEMAITPADYVLVEVQDTGHGIPADVLAKIFEPFFTTKEVGRGSGLGLSMVYGIVKQTGGYVFCESEVGAGATFSILLPRFIGPETEEPVKKEAANPTADLAGHGTILLVEDEEAVRAFVARALISRGYTVLEADSGVGALRVAEEAGSPIDLIVSDVVMPDMDGPTMLNELRRRGFDSRVIFVSAYGDEALARSVREKQDFVFMPKPFTAKQLLETVKVTMAPTSHLL